MIDTDRSYEDGSGARSILTVSELTHKIKVLLEQNFPLVWIHGEISNLRIPSSGHAYFTLKDDRAQISAVLFRNQLQTLKFSMEDGLQVLAMGRVSLYEPRGTYQVILEYCEPAGVGALQLAFEQLKRKLAAEGLFDVERKRPLPFLPQTVALITSATGAVVHDMQTVMQRRFPGIDTLVLPVAVQGPQAAEQIVDAIEQLKHIPRVDVAIVARGGGSLEDLQAFNDERVARAIFSASVPIISAVGHETDYTIADFVADLRAPTPSVAAEMVVPIKAELKAAMDGLSATLAERMLQLIRRLRDQVHHLGKRLVHPRRRIDERRLRVDEISGRLEKSMWAALVQKQQHLAWSNAMIRSQRMEHRLQKEKEKLEVLRIKILENIKKLSYQKRANTRQAAIALQALNPLAVLERGYSLTRRLPGGEIVRDSRQVAAGDPLEVLLARGALEVHVSQCRQDKGQGP